MNQTPHRHPCGLCGRSVDCRAAREGGCIFQPTTAMTCGRCEQERFGSGDPDAGEHLCQCPAPDPPRDGVRCARCNRWVSMFDPDRVLDLERLGREA